MSKRVYGEGSLRQLGEPETLTGSNRFCGLSEIMLADENDQPLELYTLVEEGDYVAVLLVDEEDQLYLTEQIKPASLQPLIEAVAGGIKVGQSPRQAAQMESLEEAGVEIDELQFLGRAYPQTHRLRRRGTGVNGVPPQCKAAWHFVARVRQITGQQLEALERIHLLSPLSVNKAINMIMTGEIVNMDTIVLILKFDTFGQMPEELWTGYEGVDAPIA